MGEQPWTPYREPRALVVGRACAIFGVAALALSALAMVALPRWWAGTAGWAFGASVVWLCAVAVWARRNKHPVKPARRRSAAGARAISAMISSGVVWLVAMLVVAPNVIGAWAIGSDPVRTTGTVDIALVRRGPDTVTYRLGGREYEEPLSVRLVWGQTGDPQQPIVIGPDHPRRVMLERDWQAGRQPWAVATLVAANVAFCAASVNVSRRRRPTPAR
ncbi:hypothetical protein [Yimella sp. cx-51]|uniref:hypothetical protein n=1 Tax=Yimella sp. cx-51 TaxID=2770551 RepID=UPI00165DDE71|nr:hypothetical protein [Yimella sp. cx-51]MBC9956314.1 hypothetical protein [Yimella sp. cx-51]QTH38553.1 hypothetical protein J5M86_02480 [Yimella sp. cx-51]